MIVARIELIEREVRDGKPFGGTWIGRSLFINLKVSENFKEDPIYQEALNRLRFEASQDLEYRNEQVFFRPPYTNCPLRLNASVGLKCIVWGRAYKVMRLFKKGVKRTKKILCNGRRKRIRIDK